MRFWKISWFKGAFVDAAEPLLSVINYDSLYSADPECRDSMTTCSSEVYQEISAVQAPWQEERGIGRVNGKRIQLVIGTTRINNVCVYVLSRRIDEHNQKVADIAK